MDGTIIEQGSFTQGATAANVTLQIRSDIDWIKVYNLTAITQTTADLGAEYYFQRGMTNGTGIVKTKLGTVANDPLTVGALAANTGFFLVDSSVQTVTSPVAITAISTANPPVVSTGTTTGLAAGDVVRFSTVAGAPQFAGIDFTIDTVVASTSFRLPYASQLAVAGTTGFWRKVNFSPLYYPRRRFISTVTAGSTTVVKMTVTHGYTVGQLVRFIVPEAYGMVELNNLTGAITAISTANNTITVNIDSSGFTAFAFPAAAAVPFSPALVVPVGEDTATALSNDTNILDDATINEGYIGVTLVAGDTSPAGYANSTSYWIAGKSFSVSNS